MTYNVSPLLLFSGFRQLRGHSDDRGRAVHVGAVRHGRAGGLRQVEAAVLPTDRRLPCLLLSRVAILI